jgi:predicted O-methyltransferase YrrM
MSIKEKIADLKGKLGFAFLAVGFRLRRVYGHYPIQKPVDPFYLEVLADARFQASVREVSSLTLLDTERLANLWMLSQRTDPKGNILEVGCYKGGASLHLSNAHPERKIIACDSFRSFETVDPALDGIFNQRMFRDTSSEKVRELFRARGRQAEVIEGFFPASCQGKALAPVSFVHLDVDVYKANIESLTFLAQAGLLLDRSLIVVDGYNRREQGTNRAVAEFVRSNPRWVEFPMFPGQCLLVPATWFSL